MDEQLGSLLEALGEGQPAAEGGDLSTIGSLLPYITFILRFILPILAAIVLVRCIRSLLRESYEPEVWGYLSLPNGSRVALFHWENIIGRAKSCDVVLNYPTMSRSHLALMRDDRARWTAIDLGSKGGVRINGEEMGEQARVHQGDVINMGGVEVALLELLPEEVKQQRRERTRPGRWIRPSGTFFFLTLFIALLGVGHCVAAADDLNPQIPVAFAALIGVMWGYFFFIRAMRRTGFEVETLAFLLCGVGLSVVASKYPDELIRSVVFILAGVIFFIVVCWILRDLNRAKKLRWPIAVAGVLFLGVGFLFSNETYGAQNWVSLGGFTLQPSEFVKVAFIFAGAATLDRLFARRNLVMFIGYSGVCLGILALMNDFGMAAVFFAAFLVIAFLRSGDVATIALSLAAVAFAGFLVLTLRPHVAARIATWGNVWDDPYGAGMQQALTMSSTASGGLFGLGPGEGVLSNVVASDTDLVFGIVAEELGLLVGLICMGAILVFAIFSIRASSTARSSFYVIGAGATVTMFMTQMILNVFGSLDIIPFTGMTFPFVSKGGSSMLACWGLLAFIKAADNRQNASIAIRLGRKTMPKPGDEDYAPYTDDDGTADPDNEDFEVEVDYSGGDYGEDYGGDDQGYEPFEPYDEYDREPGEPLEGGVDQRFFDGDWEDEK